MIAIVFPEEWRAVVTPLIQPYSPPTTTRGYQLKDSYKKAFVPSHILKAALPLNLN